jgi:hypothetical protein
MQEVAGAQVPRKSRFWLYTPIALLLLVLVAWSVAWWVMRSGVCSPR